MEFLKKTTAIVTSILLTILLINTGSTQAFSRLSINQSNNDFKALQKAFSDSYTSENQKMYAVAIKAINNVYIDNYECNLRLGWLSYLAKNYEQSVNYYERAVALMPVATEPLWGQLNPLITLEQWNKVDKVYLKILKIDAKNFAANYRLGLLYYYRKDYVSAKKYFDVALNISPFEYNVVLMSAWTNYFLGQKKQANHLFNKVLMINSNDISAIQGLKLSND